MRPSCLRLICVNPLHASISPPAFPINRYLRTHLKEELVAALCNNNHHHHQKGTAVSALQPSIKCGTVGMGGLGVGGCGSLSPYPVEARCHSSAFPLKKTKTKKPPEWSTQQTEWRENLSCFVVSLAIDQHLYSCCIYAAPFSVSDPCTPPTGPERACRRCYDQNPWMKNTLVLTISLFIRLLFLVRVAPVQALWSDSSLFLLCFITGLPSILCQNCTFTPPPPQPLHLKIFCLFYFPFNVFAFSHLLSCVSTL